MHYPEIELIPVHYPKIKTTLSIRFLEHSERQFQQLKTKVCHFCHHAKT